MKKDQTCRLCGNEAGDIARVVGYCVGFSDWHGYVCFLCSELKKGKKVLLKSKGRAYNWDTYRRGRVNEIPTP